MGAILYSYWAILKRQPLLFIGTIFLTIGFAFVLGGAGSDSINVAVYTEELTEKSAESKIIAFNDEQDRFTFYLEDAMTVEQKLRQNAIDHAVQLKKGNFQLIVATESPQTMAITSFLQRYYVHNHQLNQAAQAVDQPTDTFSEIVQKRVDEFGYSIEIETTDGQQRFIYDQSLQSLFGFSLFFVFYSVAVCLSTIVKQKQDGTWNRIMLSPISKMKIYLGHLTFSFFLGYTQLFIVFSLFYAIFDVNFYGGFLWTLLLIIPYVFAIVSLGVLLSSVVSSQRQLDGLIPLTAVSMAMIGGAYWPIEIVSSEFLLTLSQFVPLTYGMDLLKGVTYLNYSPAELLYSIAILLLMGVIFIGIGLNFMERRSY